MTGEHVLTRGARELRIVTASLNDKPVVLLAHWRRYPNGEWEIDTRADKLALAPEELDAVIAALQKARGAP